MIAVVGVIRSPLIAIASAPADPQLLDHGADVARADEVVGFVAVGRDGRLRVLELEDDPGPRQRDQAGGDPGLFEPRIELPDEVRRALALALHVLDLRAQLEDLCLQAVLLGLQLVGGLDKRRPLLGRVADPRALRGELRGDRGSRARAARPRA